MCIFKKKPLEYKDIEYSIKFIFADENEIRRVLNNFADAVREYNREHFCPSERKGKYDDNNL